jgi:DNA-binding CsgD family transcriptional regulator/tetratricopeptide (TPR) repeat protein
MLTEREQQLGELTAGADEARAGRGGVVIVCGESGAGKTSFVETFLECWPETERMLWAGCDPLSTPRPLGPVHDLASQFAPATQKVLRDGDQPHTIFSAVFEDFIEQPSVLVIDDLHWADQATVDLLRFVLRRVQRTHSFVVGTLRDDELGPTHPMRSLLGDAARAPHARSLSLPPLSLAAVTELVGDRLVDPVRLHRITAGNAFFVVEMLDHIGEDLPTTVRDAVLARTVGLDLAAWDLLYLLACAPGAIPDYLLADLGVSVPALRTLDEAKLIRRSDRGVAFRHDLCRVAVESVIPPGAEAGLHRRMIHAYESASRTDPAVLTHHALGAEDAERIRRAAADAGRAAARSGAHTQAVEFYRIALDRGGPLPADSEAELLELLADECFLTDRLDDAIGARRGALHLREQAGIAAAVSTNHQALAIPLWNNGKRSAAEYHAAQAVAAFDGHLDPGSKTELALYGHALTTQAYFAAMTRDFTRAAALLSQAGECAGTAGDPTLVVRVAVIEGFRAAQAGDNAGREAMLSVLKSVPQHFDEIYGFGCTHLSFVDIEQRRLNQAAEVLDIITRPSADRDVPLSRLWQLANRARLKLLVGDWDDALVDAETVLDSTRAPLTRTWPLLVRSLISLRRDGTGVDGIDEAWRLLCQYGEPLRSFPAAAIAERAWLTGTPDDRLDECRTGLDSGPVDGLEWARGELVMWLRRLDPSVNADGVAAPYRLFLDGSFEEAADEFHRRSMPYEAALALLDSGDHDLARRGLDALDRLGAAAVAAKVRRDLRSRGLTTVPARRRSITLTNPAGLTARQTDVLRLIGDGLTNAELAERLYLSVKTVEHHISAILAKLHATNRRDAVRRARELGIVN